MKILIEFRLPGTIIIGVMVEAMVMENTGEFLDGMVKEVIAFIYQDPMLRQNRCFKQWKIVIGLQEGLVRFLLIFQFLIRKLIFFVQSSKLSGKKAVPILKIVDWPNFC